MSEAHLEFIRRHLRAVIARASRSGLSHPAPFVRESTQRRVTFCTQSLQMLEHVTVDPEAFAKALGWQPLFYQQDLRIDIRQALARDFLAKVTPPMKGDAP